MVAGGVFVRAAVVRTAGHQDARLAVALGINVGVYMGIVACVATALIWLMRPTVIENQGLAAYKAPPGAFATHADPARRSPALPELPETVGAAQRAPVVAASPVAATKTETKKRETRTLAARERSNPFWDNAAAPSRGFRPWF